eukprot:4094590-Pyramimonas_sp.AAC.1
MNSCRSAELKWGILSSAQPSPWASSEAVLSFLATVHHSLNLVKYSRCRLMSVARTTSATCVIGPS